MGGDIHTHHNTLRPYWSKVVVGLKGNVKINKDKTAEEYIAQLQAGRAG